MSSSDVAAPSSSSCCSDIRSSTSFVVGSNSSNVRIDAAAIAREIRDNTQHYTSDKLPPSWASYYHYADGTDLTAQYVFVLDAVNFCFWPLEGYEYDDLAGSLKSVLTSDPSAFSASKLAAVTEEIVTQWLQPTRDGTFWKSQHTLAVQRREAIANGTIAADSPYAAVPIPLLAARTRAIREIGSGLLKFFDGAAANLVRAAKGDVTRLVELITATFPAFRDSAVYRGRQIFLYKRAQILVGDLWGAFQGKGLGEFHNMHELTCFADYRVPQVLRASGILVYSPQLAADIDARKEMTPSELEIELRSATIQAVELMVKELKTHGVTLCPFQLDWLLWERGEANLDKLAPHHRVTTIFY